MEVFLHQRQDADELKHQIAQTTNAMQRDRLRAVQLAASGESTQEIMRMIGRSRGFVQRWVYVYRATGWRRWPLRLPRSAPEAACGAA